MAISIRSGAFAGADVRGLSADGTATDGAEGGRTTEPVVLVST